MSAAPPAVCMMASRDGIPPENYAELVKTAQEEGL